MRLSLKTVVLGGVFTALLAVSAFIRIPMPLVPITLQAEMAILIGLLLGPRIGFCSTALYLVLGLIGLPIFAGGGGLGYVLKPSFGYLLGFCAGAVTAGLIAQKSTRFLRLLGAALAGLAVIYLFGVSYYGILALFYLDSPLAFWPLMVNYVLIFLPTDIPLCALCAFLASRLRPYLAK